MLRELRKKSVKRGYYHQLLALDFENDTKTGAFICCGAFGKIKKRTSKWINGKPQVVYENETIERYFDNQKECEDFLLSLKKNSCLLVFFNLSYDKLYLNNIIAPYIKSKPVPILRSGSRIISLTLKNGIKALDLCNHVDGSLASWIKYLEFEKKLGIKKESLDNLKIRVMSDAKATYYLGSFIQDFYFKECGIPLQLTVGACGMRLFTQKYFTDFWQRDNDFLSTYERSAYYGGRTELFKKGSFKTFNYDVNSMYLSIMREALIPDAASSHYIENGKNYKRYLNKYLGVYRVRVKTPDNLNIPLLPVRIDGKLKFPVGEFTGVWNSPELIKALELGYKILKCFDFIYYKNSKYYFKDYADFVWKKRTEYKAAKNKGMDLMIKKLGNALYGKFAQRNSNDFFGKIQDINDIPDGSEIFDVNGEIWIKIKGELTPAKFEFPCVSSFITSYARLKLYAGIEANEKNMIYCDTDSLKLTQAATGIKISKELGEFSDEGIANYEFFKPKFYRDLDTKNETISQTELETSSGDKSLSGYKCKGVPKRAELIKRTPEYAKFRYQKPLKEREAIRRKTCANIWVEIIKVAMFKDDKRNWKRNGNSTPVNYEN